MAAHRSGGRPAIESFPIICSASGLMSLMLWRKLFNRLERPEDRRRGRHCAESLAIANREYLKRRQKTAPLGGCFRRPFHRSPTREHRRSKLFLCSCAKLSTRRLFSSAPKILRHALGIESLHFTQEPDMDRPRHFTCPTGSRVRTLAVKAGPLSCSLRCLFYIRSLQSLPLLSHRR